MTTLVLETEHKLFTVDDKPHPQCGQQDAKSREKTNGSPQKDELQCSILLLGPLNCLPSTLVRQRSPWSREFDCSIFWLKSSVIPAVSQVIGPSC